MRSRAATVKPPCRDNFLGGSYFVAATRTHCGLLETTGYARSYTARINALRPKRSEPHTGWLTTVIRPPLAQQDAYSSRHFHRIRACRQRSLPGRQHAGAGGRRRDPEGPQAAARVGLFFRSVVAMPAFRPRRWYICCATTTTPPPRRHAAHRRSPPASRAGLAGIARVTARRDQRHKQYPHGCRAGERDRTGAPRRVSAVAVSRAFGLARHVLGDSKFEALACSVAAARQLAERFSF